MLKYIAYNCFLLILLNLSLFFEYFFVSHSTNCHLNSGIQNFVLSIFTSNITIEFSYYLLVHRLYRGRIYMYIPSYTLCPYLYNPNSLHAFLNPFPYPLPPLFISIKCANSCLNKLVSLLSLTHLSNFLLLMHIHPL